MPPHSNADVYAAVEELGITMTRLRREHNVTKSSMTTLLDQLVLQQRHMNRIDQLIDEHQFKIDCLMHMVHVDVEIQSTSDVNSQQPITAFPSNDQLPVSPWPRITVNHSSLIDQGGISDSGYNRPPVSDQHFVPFTITSTTHEQPVSINSQQQQQSETRVSIQQQQVKHNSVTSAVATPTAFPIETSSTSPMDLLVAAPPSYSSISGTAVNVYRKPNKTRSQSLQLSFYQNRLKQRKTTSKPTQSANLNSASPSVATTSKSSIPTLESTRRVDSRGKVTYSCCGFKFLSACSFGVHVKRKHTHERNHQCDDCWRAFTTNYDLLRHMREVHGKSTRMGPNM